LPLAARPAGRESEAEFDMAVHLQVVNCAHIPARPWTALTRPIRERGASCAASVCPGRDGMPHVPVLLCGMHSVHRLIGYTPDSADTSADATRTVPLQFRSAEGMSLGVVQLPGAALWWRCRYRPLVLGLDEHAADRSEQRVIIGSDATTSLRCSRAHPPQVGVNRRVMLASRWIRSHAPGPPDPSDTAARRSPVVPQPLDRASRLQLRRLSTRPRQGCRALRGRADARLVDHGEPGRPARSLHRGRSRPAY
jgi:hypothetical protein